jgi:hypothetical protein
MTYCNTMIDIMLPRGRFFIEEDLNVHYAVDVFGITPRMEEDQSRMASGQNFADTVCKIRRVRAGSAAARPKGGAGG